MKTAAIYMRVSTSKQEDEQTIQNQEMALKEQVEKDGNILSPENIYADNGWTGTLIERPELDRLRIDAKDGRFEVLYFYDRGRLSRVYVHQEIILDELRKAKIELVSLHDTVAATPEERVMGGVMGLFQEYERTKITERMRMGKLRKVKENKKLLGYNGKYGYEYHEKIKNGENARDGYFTINEEQAKNVRYIFELYNAGASVYEIRKILFEHKIYPPKMKRAYWSTSVLRRLISDTTYIGEHYYNKTEATEVQNPIKPKPEYSRVAKGSRTVRPKEEWLLIEVPAIIDTELFKSVQARRALRAKTNPRNNKRHNYLVSGIINCACGKARTGDPGGNNHYYYRCTDRIACHPAPRQCYEKGINAEVLDELVWNTITAHLLNPQLIAEQAEAWLHNSSPLQAQVDGLTERLSKLDEEERRLVKVYTAGLVSEQAWKGNMDELRANRAQVLAQLNSLQDELANKPKLTVENLVDAAPIMLQELDFQEKKTIIQMIVKKIEATKKEVTIWGILPVNTSQEIGFEPFYWHRRPPKCRQVYPVQRADE